MKQQAEQRYDENRSANVIVNKSALTWSCYWGNVTQDSRLKDIKMERERVIRFQGHSRRNNLNFFEVADESFLNARSRFCATLWRKSSESKMWKISLSKELTLQENRLQMASLDQSSLKFIFFTKDKNYVLSIAPAAEEKIHARAYYVNCK